MVKEEKKAKLGGEPRNKKNASGPMLWKREGGNAMFGDSSKKKRARERRGENYRSTHDGGGRIVLEHRGFF